MKDSFKEINKRPMKLCNYNEIMNLLNTRPTKPRA